MSGRLAGNAGDEPLLCIIRFAAEAESSNESDPSELSAPQAQSGGLLGRWASCCLAKPSRAKALLDAAREGASLDGKAEWATAWQQDDGALIAGVLFRGDASGVSKLLDAAKDLKDSCAFVGEDVTLLSCDPYGSVGEDRFQVCSRLFLVHDTADIAEAGLQRLPVDSVVGFRKHGFCMVDAFLEPGHCAAIPVALEASVEEWLELSGAAGPGCTSLGQSGWLCGGVASALGLGSDIQWFVPEPRTARDDYIATLSLTDRAARQPPLGAVVSALREVLADLQLLLRLRGDTEVQLGWYPCGSAGYRRHYDAGPDDGTSRQRRVTAILYCNPAWEPGHGGELRLWPEGLGSSSVDVQPLAGRLLVFLSGCVPHEVLPTSRSRAAVTMWVH